MSPFTDIKKESVVQLGESQLIREIKNWLGSVTPPSPGGIGDDCAVLNTDSISKLLVSADSLVFGRHFDEKMSPEAAGIKLLKRNLSDIAAMGGTPHSTVVSLLLGQDCATEWIKRFYLGLAEAAARYEVTIVGGDISSIIDGQFAATMTIHGSANCPIRRNNSRKNDHIFVTGSLGGSILGKHRDFLPRLEEGQWLAKHEEVHSMIDITDGLAKDLPALLSEDQAAFIDPSCIPLSEAAHEMAFESGRNAIEHALCDGEDYELLFTLDARVAIDEFYQMWRARFSTGITYLGRVETTEKTDFKQKMIDSKYNQVIANRSGYEHLSH